MYILPTSLFACRAVENFYVWGFTIGVIESLIFVYTFLTIIVININLGGGGGVGVGGGHVPHQAHPYLYDLGLPLAMPALKQKSCSDI